MRVGINSLFLVPGSVGGSETYLTGVLDAVAGQKDGPDLTIFTNRENHDLLSSRPGAAGFCSFVPINVRARSRTSRILAEQIQLPLRAAQAGLDVLWSPGYTAPFTRFCPQVVSVLDMQYCEFPEDWPLLARLAHRVLIPLSIRRSARCITISRFSRSQIVKHTGTKEDRIDVTYLGVDDSFRSIQGTDARRRVAGLLPNPAPYFLCVANSYPHKNLHSLVNAFDGVAPGIPHQLVLVGGEGTGERRLAEELRVATARKRVVRMRGIDRKDLAALYACSDTFVFPSLYEGFGLPVLEAMAAGTLVLTTRCASIPEVGGDCVLYFDHTQPEGLREMLLRATAMQPAERSDMTQRAARRAELFNWQKTALGTVESLAAACRAGH
jgi:glycosyltransferase involved in cell wall biosynthesis